MKKYRIIEFDPRTNNIVVKEEFKDFEKAVSELGQYIKDDSKCYFRIEEVEGSIMDRVKTYEDACDVLGKEECDKILGVQIFYPHVNTWINVQTDYIIALLKLEAITAALNEGWKPDWEDVNQTKWFVTYNGTRTGVMFTDIKSVTISRLYFKSQKLAEYASKQFADLYKQLLIEKI